MILKEPKTEFSWLWEERGVLHESSSQHAQSHAYYENQKESVKARPAEIKRKVREEAERYEYEYSG